MTTDRRSLLRLPLAAAALNFIPAIAKAATPTESPPMTTDHVHDFDFFFGAWSVKHRYLKARLDGSTEWLDLTGTCTAQPTMGGAGNMDDNIINKPEGSYRAMTVRTYDPKTQTWAIWWFDGRNPHGPVDPPMIGSFLDGVGTFFAHDTLNGKKIKVRFLWSAITPNSCRWEQAFSEDNGATWETNWIMENTRTA